ncbi:hypothetical protein DIPPA_31909 [Diplonema papillatum]|nr:hypothetical protein DIPPA_31909 [Diplonema papillatum]
MQQATHALFPGANRSDFADEDVVQPMDVPPALRKSCTSTQVHAVQVVDKVSSRGTRQRRVLYVSSNQNPWAVFLTDLEVKDSKGAFVRRVFKITDIKEAVVCKDVERNMDQFMLVMHEATHEPALVWTETNDSLNQRSSNGKRQVLRSINYMKVLITGTKLPVWDLQHTMGRSLYPDYKTLMTKTKYYRTPSEKFEEYKRLGPQKLYEKLPAAQREEPLLIEFGRLPSEPSPNEQPPSTSESPDFDRLDAGPKLPVLMAGRNFAVPSPIVQRSSWKMPVRRKVAAPRPVPPVAVPHAHTIPIQKVRHVMRHRGQPPRAIYPARGPAPDTRSVAVEAAVGLDEGRRIDTSLDELPFEDARSTFVNDRWRLTHQAYDTRNYEFG